LAGISLGTKLWEFGGKITLKSSERKTLAGRALLHAQLRLLSHCAWNYLHPFGLCRCAWKNGRKAGRKKSHKKWPYISRMRGATSSGRILSKLGKCIRLSDIIIHAKFHRQTDRQTDRQTNKQTLAIFRPIMFHRSCLTLNPVEYLSNCIARHGQYGQMDFIIGRNILNSSFCWQISLDNILNLHFRQRDIYSYYRANVSSSALLSSLIELLQCRDGSLSLSSSEFNMARISSMIDYICTL